MFKLNNKLSSIVAACALSVGALTTVAHAGDDAAFTNSIEHWVNSPHRSEKNSARDKYRHPVGTLTFFGVKEDMHVAEIWPGSGGWYQEILAPFLMDKGQYYSVGRDKNTPSEYYKRSLKAIDKRIKSQPEYYGKMIVTELGPKVGKFDIAPEGSLDMVVSFRNFHNWKKGKYDGDVINAVHKALKVGGVFAMTDHRKSDAALRDIYDGYILEEDVISALEKAGFKLVEKSEVNANPNDSKDHVNGVWTLPPRLAGDPKDHDKMRAIGESDRMTLKFEKVAQ